MAFTKSDLCNMSLSNLGLANVVVDVDNPTNRTETIFNQYYDLVLTKALRRERPQFATYDDSLVPQVWADGSLHFMVPSYALEILRVNGYDQGWTVEHGEIIFLSGIPMTADGFIQVKYIRKIEDIGLWTPEFFDLMAWELAGYCAGKLTQDANALQLAATASQGARKEYQTANLRSAKPRLKTQGMFNKVWRR
jgi:hypothetical protein